MDESDRPNIPDTAEGVAAWVTADVLAHLLVAHIKAGGTADNFLQGE